MIILPDGRDIVYVVAGEPGQKSDITLFRENRTLRAKTKIQRRLGLPGRRLNPDSN